MSSVSASLQKTSWALSSFFDDVVSPSCYKRNINRPINPAILEILSEQLLQLSIKKLLA
jgi:hypothetical protein